MIDRRRLQTPSDHLATLSEPPLSDVTLSDSLLQRDRVPQFADVARPIIMTGHQAEFFHAGVFAKIIAATQHAAARNGSAVFLVVDTDETKQTSIAVPRITNAGLRRHHIPIPGMDARIPVCDLAPVARKEWLAFFTTIANELEHYDVSLLPIFADAFCNDRSDEASFVDRWIAGTKAVCDALDLPASIAFVRMTELADTRDFQTFFKQIATNANEFAESHNDAIAAYRERHNVRTRNRPIPLLHKADSQTEIPFWLADSGSMRRRLSVMTSDGKRSFYADGKRVAAEPSETRIFPRALTLSAFCRLYIADLFIHGIGGAKYDEITNDFLAEFFANRPAAPIACVTATLHLPLPKHDASKTDLRSARRRLRDLQFNPQRYIDNLPPDRLAAREGLIHRSDQLRAIQGDKAERRRVFDAIRAINAELLEHAPQRMQETSAEVETIEENFAINEIARDREYFFAFHTRQVMIELADKLVGKQKPLACREG